MSAIFQTSLYVAQKTAQELQKAIGLYETKVLEYQNNFSKSNKERDEIIEKIKAEERRCKDIEEKQKNHSDTYRNVQEQQNQLRKHVSFLDQLAGHVETLKSKVESCRNETALNILEKIVTQWQDKDGQGLLNVLGGDEIRKHVRKLNETIQFRAVNTA